MNRAGLEQFVTNYIEHMNRHDARSLAALYATDCSVDSPLFATLHGRAKVEDAYAQWFRIFPDLQLQIESATIDPPSVTVLTRNNGTHESELLGLPPTHKRVTFRSVRLVTLNDQALIASERRVYDFTGLLVQLGVLRAMPAKT